MAETQQRTVTEGEEMPQLPPNTKEFTFYFRTEKLKDEDGKEIGEGKKHPDVKAPIPVPSVSDVISMLAEEGKPRDYILSLIYDGIQDAARGQINDWREANPDGIATPTILDLSKLTVPAIATMPKSARGSNAPSEEDMKVFTDLYTDVMIHKVQYEPKKVKVHVDHLKAKLGKVKNDKPVVQKFKDLLTVFAANAEQDSMEETATVFDYLMARADKYLKAEEKNTLEAL